MRESQKLEGNYNTKTSYHLFLVMSAFKSQKGGKQMASEMIRRM